MDRLHQVAAKAKDILGESIQSQKSLRLTRRGKPTHVTFSLASRLVRDFDAVVGVDRIDVLDGRHDLTVCGITASQFIGHQPSGFTALAFQ
jgi:hypothetical protein